jgi:hypothetical protein
MDWARILAYVTVPILWGTVAFVLNLCRSSALLWFHLIEGETVTPMLLGQTVHPQSRPRHHLSRLLVLDVGHSGRDPLCAHAGGY